MAKLSVPINCKLETEMDAIIKALKEMKADRVFMHFSERGPFKIGERSNRIIELYKKKRQIFEENGFETAVWISTFGYGGVCENYYSEDVKHFTRNVSIKGNSVDDCFCPEDEAFTTAICNLAGEFAKNGTKMLMLDDELALSAVTGIGCACDIHMKKYCELIGEKILREELADKIFTGGKNKYRDAWLTLQGDSMRKFCRTLRETVDKINPEMRLGFCTGYTSWDLEGADAIELTKILAGNTKPFLRFTGAPYWYANKRFGALSMQSIVEITRQQYQWCENSGIEVFTENDSYPRNRFLVPSSYVEGFDLATRVSDNMDNLKYVFGYVSQPWYENGYLNEHIKNLDLYDEISKAFDDKKATGIRIYEEMRIIENMDLPDKFIGESKLQNRWIVNHSSQIPTSHAIPTTYSGTGLCGLVFGEHAKYLPKEAFERGLILDIKAAEILQNKGIDVGFESKSQMDYMPVERFSDYGTDVGLTYTPRPLNIKVNKNAKVISTFYYNGIETPSAYLYENEDKQKFLVYAFDIENLDNSACILQSYCRGKQLNDSIKWLCGKSMPVVCNGHPMLYCICKENETELAAGYFNFHADEINNAEIILENKPSKIKFINCEGNVTDNGVVIKHIKSFGFAGIVFDK